MSTEAARITQLLRLAVKYYKPFYICKHNATNLRSRKYFLELSPKSMKFSDSQTYSSLAWTRDWGDYANIWNRTNNWRQRTLTVDPSWHYGWLYSLQVIDFLSLTPLRIVATVKNKRGMLHLFDRSGASVRGYCVPCMGVCMRVHLFLGWRNYHRDTCSHPHSFLFLLGGSKVKHYCSR